MTDRPASGQKPDLSSLDPQTRLLVVDLITAGPDPSGAWASLLPIINARPEMFSDPAVVKRACALAGASRALSTTLASTPDLLTGVASDASITLKVRGALVQIAGDDLSETIDVMDATRKFSDAIDAIFAETLESVREVAAQKHSLASELPFAIIAMGKWGAQEFNYASDIDLVFVHDNLDGQETQSRSTALAIASKLVSRLSAATFDGPALRIDTDLRPEGAMGPLSRAIDGYAAYYERWADPWELQALIKARPAAGTPLWGSGSQPWQRKCSGIGGSNPSPSAASVASNKKWRTRPHHRTSNATGAGSGTSSSPCNFSSWYMGVTTSTFGSPKPSTLSMHSPTAVTSSDRIMSLLQLGIASSETLSTGSNFGT